jgi:hypothetical protein
MKLFRTIEAVADGHYCVGDVITFTLNDGEEVEALAVKQEQDGMIFVLVDCLRKEYSMNRTSSNRGGYKSCALRKALNTEILDRFPAEIREKMVAFESGDLLRLPTEREIFGYNPYGEKEPDDVEQWEPMKDRRNRIAFQGSKTGTWEWYWLQNKVEGSAAGFAIVDGDGFANCYNASDAYGVRPAFKI